MEIIDKRCGVCDEFIKLIRDRHGNLVAFESDQIMTMTENGGLQMAYVFHSPFCRGKSPNFDRYGQRYFEQHEAL